MTGGFQHLSCTAECLLARFALPWPILAFYLFFFFFEHESLYGENSLMALADTN